MAHHSHDPKPLWLVNPRLNAKDYRDQLIGSVVKYPDLPIERHVPYKGSKLPKDIVPGLDPEPVQVRNVSFWRRRAKDASVGASLNDILDAFVERAKESSSENVATVARMWHMDSPGEKFKELLKNRQYFEELFGLLRENHDEGYFITDVVTLTNLEVKESNGSMKGAGAGVNVPVDQTLGLVTAGVNARASVRWEKGFGGCFEGETIVLLGYRLVKLEKVDGTRAKLGRAFLGKTHGFAVRDNMDYWPKMVERPVEGNVPGFLNPPETPAKEERKELVADEMEGIVEALGFDVEIVG